MNRFTLLALAPLVVASQGFAQTVDPHAEHEAVSSSTAAPAETAPMADDHAGHDMAGMEATPASTGVDMFVGFDEPPPTPTDNLADSVFGASTMSGAREVLREEHGGASVSKFMADTLELTSGSGDQGYRWGGEFWSGGDINRLLLKSEGEGDEHGLEAAEIQVLYSRAVARYTDLQLGLRYDFEPYGRTYAVVGIETVLPYWFETGGSLFISEDGDLLGRAEGSYDFRLTQRLILQPLAELEFAAQAVPATGTGPGLSTGEIGLRLRYEFRREFAPYIGVTYERSFGRTADIAIAAGEDTERTKFVVGVRAWF